MTGPEPAHAVEKDAAVFHLPGHPLPALVSLPCTDGASVDLFMLSLTRPVLLSLFPWRSQDAGASAGADLGASRSHDSVQQLQSIKTYMPRLRDCMPDLVVYGLSTSPCAVLTQLRDTLQLPFESLSDHRREWADKLELPTTQEENGPALRRCTLLLKEGQITRLDFPLRQPSEAGARALELLRRDTGKHE